MEITSVIPSDEDMNKLKETATELKRKHEYESLMKEVQDLRAVSLNGNPDIEGVMKIADTDKHLKTKRKLSGVVEMESVRSFV